VGLPSALLERRPDLRAAEQELVASNADVGATVAGFFPTLSLTGAFGASRRRFSNLLSGGRTWSAGGGLLGPVFQGRRLKNQHRAAAARFEQARVRFEQSVTSAFAEVSTALVAYQKLAEVEKEQARAVAAYREAVRLSSSRYLAGLSDYLECSRRSSSSSPPRTRWLRPLQPPGDPRPALQGARRGWKLSDPEWSEPARVRQTEGGLHAD